MTTFGNFEWFLEAKRGNIPGVTVVSKFGSITNLGTSLTPVTGSGVYRTPTSATALELLSSSTADTSAGAGAREITITGLNSAWEEETQTVTTNGTSAVALGTNLIRVYRLFVSSSGTYADASNASQQGTITIRESGGGATWATIPEIVTGFGAAQSTIACYSIPINKTGFVYIDDVFSDSTKTTDLFFFSRENANDISVPYSGVMRIQEEIFNIKEEIPFNQKAPFGPYTGPCDIGFLAKLRSGSNGELSINFDIVMYDD